MLIVVSGGAYGQYGGSQGFVSKSTTIGNNIID